jgi:DNA-directed RNA polymerase subunit H (RpoH/RPB5)
MEDTCEQIIVDGELVDREDAYRWFKVKKTQCEMMQDRGMKIPKGERFLVEFEKFFSKISPDGTKRQHYYNVWEKKTIKDFVEKYSEIALEESINFNSTLSQVYVDEKKNINVAVIYLCRERESNNITMSEFNKKFHYYKDNYFIEGKGLMMIFISEVSLSKQIQKAEKFNFVKTQFFETRELFSNPTHSKFYYPHYLLTKEEIAEQLTRNHIRPEELGIIRRKDPIIKYFNWPKGGIVRIDRVERYLQMPARKSPYWRRII